MFVLAILLFKMAIKHSAEVLPSVSRSSKKAMMSLTGKIELTLDQHGI